MITISKLLVGRGGRVPQEQLKELLPPNLIDILPLGNEHQKSQVSRFNTGADGVDYLYEAFTNCLFNADDETFRNYLNHISEYWGSSISAVNVFQKIDKEEDSIPPELLFWITENRANNNRDNLSKMLMVFTVLAVTRGNWNEIADKLYASLPSLDLFSYVDVTDFERVFEDDSYNLQEYVGLRDRVKKIENGNFRYVINYLDEIRITGKNLWNAYVCYKFYKSSKDNDSTRQKLELLKQCLEHLTNAIEFENETSRRCSIQNWRFNTTQELLLKVLFNSLKANPALFENLQNYFEPNNDDNKTQKELKEYGEFYFELANKVFNSEEFQENRLTCLKFGEQINNPECMQDLMLIYLADENEETQDKGWKLAEKLARITVSPKICGDACWRLYNKTKNRDYLKNAFRCGTPQEAVREYSNDKILYSNYLERADVQYFKHAGNCLINVEKNHPIARVFEATKPETWSSYFGADNTALDKFIDPQKGLILILVKNSTEDNLKDFLYALEKLKEKSPAYSVFFIRANEEDLIVNLVDTAINRFYNFFENKNKPVPLIRVQIIEEPKLAAQNILAKIPLFYPLWKNPNINEKVHLVIVGTGETVSWLEQESRWLMTDLSFDEEITKLDSVENIAVFENILANNQLLYFAVDTGNGNLANFATAIKIREILIRHWAKTAEGIPMDTPVIFFSNDLDISFLSRYSTFCGQYGEAWYNSPNVVAYGGDIWTWDNLVCDVIEKISVCTHLDYFGENYDVGYYNYSRWIYNHDSSRAVAFSIPYRLYKWKPQIFTSGWAWNDTNFLFSQDNRENFAEHITDENKEAVIVYEVNRWKKFMETRGWQSVSVEIAKKYNSQSSQDDSRPLFIAKLHPALFEYSKLDNLKKNLGKDFKAINIKNIEQTANFLKTSFFKEKNDIVDKIKLLFGIE